MTATAPPQPSPLPERADGEPQGDLRILTPGLSPEEIAAVTSVVTAMIEEQRAARRAPAYEPHWRHAVEPFGDRSRGPIAWRHAAC